MFNNILLICSLFNPFFIFFTSSLFNNIFIDLNFSSISLKFFLSLYFQIFGSKLSSLFKSLFFSKSIFKLILLYIKFFLSIDNKISFDSSSSIKLRQGFDDKSIRFSINDSSVKTLSFSSLLIILFFSSSFFIFFLLLFLISSDKGLCRKTLSNPPFQHFWK